MIRLTRLERRIRGACDAGAHADAARLIIEGYGGELLGFLRSRLADSDASDEVFAQLGEELLRSLPRFEWQCSARAWAYTLARHTASRYFRSPARRPAYNRSLSAALETSKVALKSRTPTRPYLRTDVKQRMRLLREQLPPDDQTLLILRVDRNLSWKEVALVMTYDGAALPAEGVKRESARLRKRFQLVKDRLRTLAEEEGLL